MLGIIMKILTYVALIFGILETTFGLSCYSCTDDDYNGESAENCFVTTSSVCSLAIGGTEYCLTKFTINDGVTVKVDKTCEDPSKDHDKNSDSMPATDKCETTLNPTGNPSDTTECYFHCSDTDNCNTKAASGLIACTGGCSGTNMAGTCDYITGKCLCNANFEGDDCNTATATPTTITRQCVQCNSETDSTCATTTTGSDCPAAQQYCSTATTTIYDPNGTAKKTVTTRGCVASMLVVDECTFTDVFTDPPINNADIGYKEITCFSTCSGNICNINTANGVIDENETVTMYCVQCDLTADNNCATKSETDRTICPVGTTHCKATVEYLISEKTDLSSPAATTAYQLQSVLRECATEPAVTRECTNTTFAGVSGVKKVTCTETCDTDGCNNGWPARPKCITCESMKADYADGYDGCLENPPNAAICTNPYEAYCTTHETGIPASNRRDSVKGFRRRMVRKCSQTDIGSGCSTQTIRNIEIDTCNYTCTTDGCNQATSGGIVPVQNIIAFMAPAVLGWLMQTHL